VELFSWRAAGGEFLIREIREIRGSSALVAARRAVLSAVKISSELHDFERLCHRDIQFTIHHSPFILPPAFPILSYSTKSADIAFPIPQPRLSHPFLANIVRKILKLLSMNNLHKKTAFSIVPNRGKSCYFL